MPEGQCQFAGGDAAAIIGDADFGHAAVADGYGDAGGTGVQGVFDQFLDHRDGAFNDFAGGDLGSSCWMGIGWVLSDGSVSFQAVWLAAHLSGAGRCP